MTVDPRAALDRFVAALEAHYHAVATRREDDDPAVDDAYDILADAFEAYDDALATVHDEATPFYLVEDEDEVVEDDAVGGDRDGDYDADVDDDALDRLTGDVGTGSTR